MAAKNGGSKLGPAREKELRRSILAAVAALARGAAIPITSPVWLSLNGGVSMIRRGGYPA